MANYPSAQYSTTSITRSFLVEELPEDSLTSNGSTSGPSPYLIQSTNGSYVDKDKPSDLKLNLPMGILRGYVTRLQDDINIYLTERIKESGEDIIDQESILEQDADEEIDEENDSK